MATSGVRPVTPGSDVGGASAGIRHRAAVVASAAGARSRTYPARPCRAVAANVLMDVRKQFAQDRLVGGGGVDTVGLPLERADDVPPLEREAIAPPLPTGYRSGAG